MHALIAVCQFGRAIICIGSSPSKAGANDMMRQGTSAVGGFMQPFAER